MTEDEWYSADSGEQLPDMLNYLWQMLFPGAIVERFLVACCRRIDEFVTSAAGRHALDTLELRPARSWNPELLQEARHSTATASREWVEVATTLHDQAHHYAEYAVNHLLRRADFGVGRHCALTAALQKLMFVEGEDADCHWEIEPDPEEEQAQVVLLRCIVGNPFRPVAFDPRWRTEHAVGLAGKMYDERNFDAMPILADALEEAGCDSRAVLDHCREPGLHARGCWVIDGVLGKR